MYLVDFDRTLFRTDDFYEFLRRASPVQVSHCSWMDAYRAYQARNRIMDIFSMMDQDLGLSSGCISNIKAIAYQVAPRFVYTDTFRLLDVLSQAADKTVIFTYGDLSFQRFKLTASGLNSYSCIITDSPKYQHSIIKKADLLIDDNPNELDLIANTTNKPVLMRVCHLGSKYSGIGHKSDNIESAADLNRLIMKLQEKEMV